MRFVRQIPINNPKNSIPGSAEAPAAIEKPQSKAEQQRNLENYFSAIELKNLSSQEKAKYQEFTENLDYWDKNGNVEEIRTAGISKFMNNGNYMVRHAFLSKAFMQKIEGSDPDSSQTKPDKKEGYKFKIDFNSNNLAEWKVGLGDMLPPNVKRVRVTKANGEVITAIRGIHPQKRRIGYYEENALKQGKHHYVAVFTGDEVEVLETKEIPKEGNRDTLSEQVEIYQNGACKDSASVGEEMRYDPETDQTYPDTLSAIEAKRKRIVQMNSKRTVQVQSPHKKPGLYTVIDGVPYQKINRDYWLRNCGNTWIESSQWIAREDPIEGGKVRFLGCPIPGGINIKLLPYLKEAEARIKAEGIDYQIRNATATAWRKIREGQNLSMHSWGAAIDINTDTNPLGSDKTTIPKRVIEIMESVGLYWGGNWKGRPDPMHFEMRINPDTSKQLIKSPEARKYLDFAEKQGNSVSFQISRDRSYAPSQRNAPIRIAQSLEAGSEGQRRQAEQGARKRIVSPESVRRVTSRYDSQIKAASIKHNVPESLIRAIMFTESGGKPNLASHAQAGGLMQIIPAAMPKHLRSRCYPVIKTGKYSYKLRPDDIRNDPDVVIDRGAEILAQNLKRYGGNVTLAAAAYNAGSGNVKKYGNRVPPFMETMKYVRIVGTIKQNLDAQNS